VPDNPVGRSSGEIQEPEIANPPVRAGCISAVRPGKSNLALQSEIRPKSPPRQSPFCATGRIRADFMAPLSPGGCFSQP
jgi:hypothetical protein